MRTLIIVLIALAALAVGLWLWHPQPPTPPPPAISVPQILAIDFPKQINADGHQVSGTIHFRAPTGTLVRADFKVVQADFFLPFSFDPQIKGEMLGSFQFFISTSIPQSIALRVILTDDQGQTSPPKDFSFTAVGMPMMPPQSP